MDVPEGLWEYLDKLVKLIEQAAPKVWEIAYRQVYVEMLGQLLGLIAGILLIVFSPKMIQKAKKIKEGWKGKASYEIDVEAALVAGYCLGLLIGVMLIFVMTYSLGARIINPNYYAVKILLSMAGIGE